MKWVAVKEETEERDAFKYNVAKFQTTTDREPGFVWVAHQQRQAK